MATLSKLQKYSTELHTEFLGEILKNEGGDFLQQCIVRDTPMLGAVVFKYTNRGVEFWWNVMDKINK